jgi:hypothetical protein
MSCHILIVVNVLTRSVDPCDGDGDCCNGKKDKYDSCAYK